MTDLDERFRAAVEETNRQHRANGGDKPPAHPLQQHYDFERLGEQIAASLLQAAEEQLTQAQNMLAQTKTFAEDVQARIAEKARELNDMNKRLQTFGSSILEAHRKFHGEPDDTKL